MKAKDMVCGMEIDISNATGKSDYKGKAYYFCNLKCKNKFGQNPEFFLALKPSEKDQTLQKKSAMTSMISFS